MVIFGQYLETALRLVSPAEPDARPVIPVELHALHA